MPAAGPADAGRRFRRWWPVALLWFAVGLQAAPIEVFDDLKRPVTIPEPAVRLVSLAPHLTEILFALGVGDQVVGTVRYSDYPAAASRIPRLGDAFSINVESVMALSPDLVVAWHTGGANRALTQLEALGVPVYLNEAPRLADIATSVRKIARLVGRPEQGQALATTFVQALADESAQKPAKSVRVFFQIADDNIYTVNDKHLIGQAIELCGGTNPFGQIAVPVPVISREAVLAAAPDLIVLTHVPGTPPSPWVKAWQEYPGFKGKVAGVDPNLISRPGLRMQEGIHALCALVRAAAH